MEPIIKNEIRLDLLFRLAIKNWKGFLVTMLATGIVTALLIVCVPRYYVVGVMLVPEYGEQSMSNGALGAAASMFGINVGGGSADAIVPELYPDIVASTDFLVSIMESEVESQDGEFKGTYGEYILKREKYPWWSRAMGKFMSLFKPAPEPYAANGRKVDPFRLTLGEFNLLKRVSSSIGCQVDEKSGVISLSAKAQDPYVAAMLANALKAKLQYFMTEYRTGKNRNELEHAVAMCDTAYVNYIDAQRRYAEYVDKHQGLSKQAYKVEEERLSGEMQLAFSMYNSLCQHKLLAEAELQKSTPVFTALQNATVPVKPAGPKRMITTIAMTIVGGLLYLVWLIVRNRKEFEKSATEE